MLSVIRHLGTEDVSRLRIGIGPQPEKMDSADFVLSRFRSSEESDLEKGMSEAEQAVRVVQSDGIDAAMNRFNPAAA